MSDVMENQRRSAVMTLSHADAAAVRAGSDALRRVERGRLDTPAWVAAAREAWDELPTALRRTVRSFRRDSGPTGTLLLRGLPVDEDNLPDTPSVDGSVQRSATIPAAVLVMTASGLGDPAAFQAEKSGALVQDVVPVPGREEFQGNSGSVLLSFHNENAFHPHRPDYVMLLCLRADHDRMAGLRTACIRQAMPLLSAPGREALFRAEFATQAPPSFGGVGDIAPPHAVLTNGREDPDLRVDFAATTALTERAAHALIELQHSFGQVADSFCLDPGDLAILDNHVAVHGRTEFRPRYDGRDRWLQRTFALASIRRCRHQRPNDGYVLVD